MKAEGNEQYIGCLGVFCVLLSAEWLRNARLWWASLDQVRESVMDSLLNSYIDVFEL